MAKVKITGHASGTGILTVTAPNTSTDRTITLPDATGTLLNSDGSGASLTALNATNLGSGTVPTARLGSGTASSSTVLYGDQTYKAEPTGGKVLQVVSAAINPSGASTTSDSFVVSQLTAAITPTATSSKILVICNAHGSNEQETRYLHWTIYRGSTNLGNGDAGMGQMFTDSDTRVRSSISAHILDSPNTTSATTYALYYRSGSSGETVELPPSTSQMNITLMEIGA